MTLLSLFADRIVEYLIFLLFTFQFTFVFPAPCSDNQYKCDGERCINSSLICQGHNPCGDGSDCKITPSPGMYIGPPSARQGNAF